MRKEILENMISSKRNNIISGDMSTGKTTNIGYGLVTKMIEKKESLFILDTKEEYINKYYNLLKDNNYNILIINTKTPKKSCGWNPLEYSRDLYKKGLKDESIKYLNILSEELFDDNSSADPFWSNMASDFFKGITLMLYNNGDDDQINFRSINSLISETDTDINYLAEYFRTMDKNDLAYICASPTVFSPLETRGGIISTAMSKLNKIVRKDNLCLLMNETTYKIKDILNNKTAIFFVADEMDDVNTLATIYIKELFNILCDNNNSNKFNFVLDNFDYIDNIINFKGMLSIGIVNNIKFYIFTRDRGRLEQCYSNYINKLANNIILNDNKILIKIGNIEKEIDNNIINELVEKVNIDYPILEDKEINIFNLKKYILKNIKIEKKDYKNYKLELSDIENYEKIKGNADNPQKRALKDNKAKFYIIKNGEKIVDNFVIFNEDNWITLENKKLLDVDYVNFILDNLIDYNYVTLFIPVTSEYIINVLKFNFDIGSITEVNQDEFIFKKIKINI